MPDHDHDHDHDHGIVAAVRGWFAPHSHGGAAELDAAAEGDEGRRALKVSLAGLAATAALQAVVVVASGSVALLGDTLHNVTDAFSAIPLWVAFTVARRPPTRRYTYGYGRAEDLAGTVVVLLIALSAAAAGYESVRRFADPQPVRHLWAVVAAGVVGFAGNELVAVYRIRAGRRIGSAALVADGLHARTDGLTSLAVVLGAAGVALGWERADAAVGLLITVAIVGVLRGAAREVYRRLMDAVDPALVDDVEATAAAVAGVEAVDSVRLRWVGHSLLAEVVVVVDQDRSVADGHAVAEAVEHAVLHRLPRLAGATVHVDPCSHGGVDHHRDVAHHRP